MKTCRASFEIVWNPNPDELNAHLERCARTCYRSQGKIGPGTAEKLLRSVLEREHESVIEHAAITVRFVVDRGVSHELVRHRLASFSQESTRYVKYAGDDSEGNEITFVEPVFWCDPELARTGRKDRVGLYSLWFEAMERAEESYLCMLANSAKPEEARSVLPNSLRTEIVMTANPREWRHVLRLRTSPKAHPQMREVMIPLAIELAKLYPVLFGEFAHVGTARDYALRPVEGGMKT